MKVSLRYLFMICMIGLMLFKHESYANGLVISNTSLTGQNTINGTWQVRFNITWENSWRDNINWDAAWVFCKFRVGAGAWQHATLSPTGFQTGSGTPINLQISCDQKGAFISRRELGDGTLSATQVELRWHYTADGVGNSDVPDLNILGMEMVYIPTGPFTIGDGNGVNSSTGGSFFAVSQHLPYTIDHLLSPNLSALTNITNTASSPANHIRIDGDGGLDINLDGIIDSAFFPTGYNAFYIMKYEVTQGQYVDFLNLLTYTQQTNRVNNATNIVGQSIVDATVGVFPGRNTIQVQVAGTNSTVPRVYSTARPDRACGHLNGADILAYLDWAALRPMTELEFEKACRGPRAPVTGEFPWGNTSSNTSNITLSGTENGTEFVTTTGRQGYLPGTSSISQGDAGQGPLRSGIFATVNSGSQITSGGTYYGVMNMGDNMNEPVVTLANVAGRSYRGAHGDGILHTNGHANQGFWPGSNSNTSVTVANSGTNTNGSSSTAAGLGLKNNASCCSDHAISNRGYVTQMSTSRTTTIHLYGGCRGVRTAFTGEFTYSNNLTGVVVNNANRFEAAQVGSGITYSWSFPSGTPSSSTVSTPNVSWSTAGTYTASLTTTQGGCSSTSQQQVVVYNNCMPPSDINWTQDVVTTWHNASSSGLHRDPRRLLDGITSGNTNLDMCRTPSTGTPAYINFDLVSNQTVSIFKLWSNPLCNHCCSGPVGNFLLRTATSLSGPWTTVFTGTGTGIDGWQTFTITPTTSRFWRLEVTSIAPHSQNYTNGPAIYEVAFEGCN
jgi:hypothetical protein